MYRVWSFWEKRISTTIYLKVNGQFIILKFCVKIDSSIKLRLNNAPVNIPKQYA